MSQLNRGAEQIEPAERRTHESGRNGEILPNADMSAMRSINGLARFPAPAADQPNSPACP